MCITPKLKTLQISYLLKIAEALVQYLYSVDNHISIVKIYI